MQKLAALFLSLIVALCPVLALGEQAEPAAPHAGYVMAGYDPSSIQHDWDNNMFFRRMEARTGISFTFRQYIDASAWTADKAKLTSARDDMPDVLFKAELTPAETQKLYADGVLIDLAPYLAEHAPNLSALLEAHPDWKDAITLPDGAIVALPNINELQNANAIWINQKWLDALKLDTPTTADELTEVLRAFKTQDPNRNGKADEVPLTFTGMWDLRFLGHAFGLYGNDYHVYAENGTVHGTLTADENRQLIEWLHLLWDEQLIDHRGFSSADSTRRITSDDADITYGVVLGPSVLNLLPTSALRAYTVLMPLQYEGKQQYRDVLGDVIRGTFAITSHCADPAALVEWVDFLYSEEGCMLASAGEKESEYEMLSDGKWSWIADTQTVAQTILPEYTIAEGAPMPGYIPLSYQMNYDDDMTHRAVELLSALREVSVLPYPLVYLTESQQSRVNELWAQIGPYSELTMARFVTGDYPLDDAAWQDFCQKVNDMGYEETIAIWQEAIH